VAGFSLALGCFAWPPPGGRAPFQTGDYLRDFGLHQVLLDRDQQIEVRYLLRAVERYPECVFATRTVRARTFEGRFDSYDHVVFGKPLPTPVVVEDRGQTPAEVLEQHAAGTRCAFFYEGLDCNLIAANGCGEQTRGLARIDSISFGNRPYSDVPERGEHSPIVSLGIFAMLPRAPSGDP
jgi:hypothetical protein